MDPFDAPSLSTGNTPYDGYMSSNVDTRHNIHGFELTPSESQSSQQIMPQPHPLYELFTSSLRYEQLHPLILPFPERDFKSYTKYVQEQETQLDLQTFNNQNHEHNTLLQSFSSIYFLDLFKTKYLLTKFLRVRMEKLRKNWNYYYYEYLYFKKYKNPNSIIKFLHKAESEFLSSLGALKMDYYQVTMYSAIDNQANQNMYGSLLSAFKIKDKNQKRPLECYPPRLNVMRTFFFNIEDTEIIEIDTGVGEIVRLGKGIYNLRLDAVEGKLEYPHCDEDGNFIKPRIELM
ncbi:hypothetical protein PCE1_004622 [Barthelona sp. PCE]